MGFLLFLFFGLICFLKRDFLVRPESLKPLLNVNPLLERCDPESLKVHTILEGAATKIMRTIPCVL